VELKKTTMKKIILFVFAFIIFSCSKTRILILKTENAEGISNETKLKVNGFEIGKIENVQLDEDGNVLITANVKSELKLPIDTEFRIEDEGFVSGKIIAVELGKSKVQLNEKSIVMLKKQNETLFNDSMKVKIEKTINQITGKDKNDSILIELRRLNKNLEKKIKANN
jgi:ABC-type transporter Mla subunit MlaD